MDNLKRELAGNDENAVKTQEIVMLKFKWNINEVIEQVAYRRYSDRVII